MQIICKYHAFSQKGLEHPQIWVAAGVLDPKPCGFGGTSA